MRGNKGGLLFLLQIGLLSITLWTPTLADSSNYIHCQDVVQKFMENLSKINSETNSDVTTTSPGSDSEVKINWTMSFDTVISVLTNTVEDIEKTNMKIGASCLIEILNNELPSQYSDKVALISILIGNKNGLVRAYGLNISSIEISKFLLKSGCRLIANPDDANALHVAAGRGYLNIVQWLVNEQNMNVSDMNIFVGNSLHFAVRNGHLDVTKWLIENTDININQQNDNGDTVLLISIKYTNIAKYLIEDAKINYTIRNKRKETVLHVAVMVGNLELVKWLIEDFKMDMNIQDIEGYTPLHLAYNHPDIVKYLIEEGADYNLTSIFKANILHFPAIRCKPDTIKVILEKCYLDVNMQDVFGFTPLHYGTECVETVKTLVEIGKIDVNIKDYHLRSTALHSACNKGHLASIKYLVENTNADVNVQDKDGNTPLHLATQYLEIVKYLVNKVDVNIVNNAGENVLEKAKIDYNNAKYQPDLGMHKSVYEWLVSNTNFTAI